MSQQQRLDYNQQIAAADTKFNKYRGNVSAPSFRKNYLKRRIQLLSSTGTFHQTEAAEVEDDNEKCVKDVEARKNINYLQIRTQLLRQKIKSQGHSDLQSTKSFSVSTGESRAGAGVNHVVSQTRTNISTPLSSEAYDFQGFHHLSDLHKAAVTHLMFLHNDSSVLVASSMDGSLSLHNLATSPPSVSLTLTGHNSGVTDFDISTSNQLLVSSSLAGHLCLWQLSSGSLLRRMAPVSPGSGLTSCNFLPSNNNLVVSGSVAGSVSVTNISTGLGVSSSTVPGSVSCLCVSGQDNLVWAGTDRATLVSFKVETSSGKLTKGHRIMVRWEQEQPVSSVSSVVSRLSPSSGVTMLLVNAGHNSLLLYTVTDSLGALSLHSHFNIVHSQLGVRSTFAPLMSYRSGECAVSASEDGGVYFFDISRHSRSCINKLQAHSCAALAVAFNYDESYLATSDESGLVIVWKR